MSMYWSHVGCGLSSVSQGLHQPGTCGTAVDPAGLVGSGRSPVGATWTQSSRVGGNAGKHLKYDCTFL